jgi:hypothetical protein
VSCQFAPPYLALDQSMIFAADPIIARMLPLLAAENIFE